MSEPDFHLFDYKTKFKDWNNPLFIANSSQSDIFRAFNITSETHRNNNYSRTIDYTGCKTILVTMNDGALTSDINTFNRFKEIYNQGSASYEIISLRNKPLHKCPI